MSKPFVTLHDNVYNCDVDFHLDEKAYSYPDQDNHARYRVEQSAIIVRRDTMEIAHVFFEAIYLVVNNIVDVVHHDDCVNISGNSLYFRLLWK